MSATDPFRPPATSSDAELPSRRSADSLVAAATLWFGLAAALLVVYLLVRPVFVNLDVDVPVLTRLLLHPMAPAMCFTIAVVVLLHTVMTENQDQRLVLGRIALALGLVTLLLLLIGIIGPLWSLYSALT